MKEEYLHHLWETKRLPVNHLKLVDGNPLEILSYGTLNRDTGPDFFNAKIKLEHLYWSGNVEMHLKASDWYVHGHDKDDTYNNVILHVVYEFDKPVFVKGRELPTLELKNYIEKEHFQDYLKFMSQKDSLPCAPVLSKAKLAVFQQVSVALAHRFDRKSKELEAIYLQSAGDYKYLIHYLLFQSFGGRVNKLPFQQLAQMLPYQILIREAWDASRLEALLLGSSGLLDQAQHHPYTDDLKKQWHFLSQKYRMQAMDASAWRFSGVRPHSFPNIKLVQLAHFLAKWKYEFLPAQASKLDVLRKQFEIEDLHFWMYHYSFKSITKKTHKVAMSEDGQNVILINAFALFYWLRGRRKDADRDIQIAIDLLLHLNPEKNKVVEKWKESGVSVDTAFDSQALLEQKQFFCENKKCLQCKIGNFMLSNKV